MGKKTKRGMKKGLLKRIKEGHARKEGTYKGFFKEKSELPKDISFWKCDERDHEIDIIPYFAGANDPVTPEGEETYVLEVFVHRNVGVMEGSIICLALTYGEPCPICEDRKKKQAAGADDDLIKSLTPSRFPRSVYNILCYDSPKEEDKGVQVWHTSNYLMEQYLLELAKVPIRKGRKGVEPFVAFIDPDEGKSIAFTSKGKKENTKFIGHRFMDRDYAIPNEVLERAYCLDDLIHKPTYDEVLEAYLGPETGEEEERPRRTRKHKKKRHTALAKKRKREEEEDDLEEDLEDDSDEEEEDLKDEDEEEEDLEDEDDEEEPEDEEEEEDDEEPEDEEEDDEDTCPADGTFGVDIDKLEDCEECDKWTACAKEERRLEEEEEERPPKKKKKKSTITRKKTTKKGKKKKSSIRRRT